MPPIEGRVRWSDGWSMSVPFPGGRIGGTYYWDPGSTTAPHLTLTRSLGMPGAGLNAVFLRQGMTSSDTLGPGSGLLAKQQHILSLIVEVRDLSQPTRYVSSMQKLCRVAGSNQKMYR
jgi:hypothetical protein